MPTLHWLTREKDLAASSQAPYRLLEAVETYGDPASENMLIQGDNLDALKALLPFYAGKVKCIYIDPPYNTKSAFRHYNDNLEHTIWLSVIYPRLELLRDLLSTDGSMFMSIDDKEGHYLKIVADEIFGRENFITSFVWQKVDSPNENQSSITPDHEYILMYSKNQSSLTITRRSDATLLDAYPIVDDDGRKCRDRLLKKNGKASLRQDRPSMYFPVTAPDGNDVYPIHDDGREARWALGKTTVSRLQREGKIIWKKRKREGEEVWIPYTREYAPENPSRPYPTILLDVKTSRQAKAHHREVLAGVDVFDTIKPEQLVERLISMCTGKGDYVLDSFLGSGTTAAVAHKMGRRYIGIEMGNHAETHCIPRLQKVIEGEQGGISKAVNWTGGGGFRFYRLGESIFDDAGKINPAIRYPALAAHIWFCETRTPLQDQGRFPLLGIHDGVAYYLLFNGILGDKSVNGGNVLTSPILKKLPPHDGPKVIYGEACRFGASRLKSEGITFKHIPYDIKAR